MLEMDIKANNHCHRYSRSRSRGLSMKMFLNCLPKNNPSYPNVEIAADINVKIA